MHLYVIFIKEYILYLFLYLKKGHKCNVVKKNYSSNVIINVL